jgi:hypothetical protein
MSVTLLRSATGGSNRASYGTLYRKFNAIFANPRIPALERRRYGIDWTQRIGRLAVPKYPLWHGLELVCARPRRGDDVLAENTRLDVLKDDLPIASYSYGLRKVHNLVTARGEDQLQAITDPEHFGHIATLLALAPEFNPGRRITPISRLMDSAVQVQPPIEGGAAA